MEKELIELFEKNDNDKNKQLSRGKFVKNSILVFLNSKSFLPKPDYF